ncbi:MAG: GNAT family N-acetyltransferase, partial [Erythrobacter sp.]
MNRQPVLEGQRVRLRPMTEADREPLYQVARDPLLWEQHPAADRWKPEVFGPFFEEGLHSGGALVVIERASDWVIGSSSLRPTPLDPAALEIGWTYLARDFWGGTINREVKRLMLVHALESVPRVLFRVGESNWRSRKAMEKIGGALTEMEEVFERGGRMVRHVVYEITRAGF